jgi:hypothetical protein
MSNSNQLKLCGSRTAGEAAFDDTPSTSSAIAVYAPATLVTRAGAMSGPWKSSSA